MPDRITNLSLVHQTGAGQLLVRTPVQMHFDPENEHENLCVLGGFLWTGAESNRRHTDFQSVALPTELPVFAHFGTNVQDFVQGFSGNGGLSEPEA